MASNAAPAEPKRSGPTKEELDATAASPVRCTQAWHNLQVLSLTEEEIQRSERARQEAEAARRAAEEKLVAESEARRRRDAERIKLQVAPNAAPAEPKRAGPTKAELDATAAKVSHLHKMCMCTFCNETCNC